MDTATMDSLRDLGCNMTLICNPPGGWLVQLTLMHGSDFCGHTGRAWDDRFEPALRGAIREVLRAADGSKCGVDVAELRRIALAVSA
jgi:hypothetical protein